MQKNRKMVRKRKERKEKRKEEKGRQTVVQSPPLSLKLGEYGMQHPPAGSQVSNRTHKEAAAGRWGCRPLILALRR